MIPTLLKVVERPGIFAVLPADCTSCLMSFLATCTCSVCPEQPPLLCGETMYPSVARFWSPCLICWGCSPQFHNSLFSYFIWVQFSPIRVILQSSVYKSFCFLPLLCCRFLYSILTDSLMILCLKFLQPEVFWIILIFEIFICMLWNILSMGSESKQNSLKLHMFLGHVTWR